MINDMYCGCENDYEFKLGRKKIDDELQLF